MDRWFGLGLLVALTVGSTGCMQQALRGGCSNGGCSSGSCGPAMTSDCGSCGMMDCGDCGGCESCESPSSGILTKARCAVANRGPCATCGNGLLGRLGGLAGVQCRGNCGGGCGMNACGGACGGCGLGGGCGTGPLGWQQGGLDYSSHLQPGLLGHGAGAQMNARPFTPGPPSAQVAYPYYTHRGPRDFLMANPPSIGR